MARLQGKRVAILVTDGFEQVEMTGPKEALEQAGASAEILSAKSGTVRGWNHTTPADEFKVDNSFDRVRAEDYDALVLPGGVVNSDNIRMDEMAQALVRDAARASKPIAVICHGGWLLISADLAFAGRRPAQCRRRLGRPAGGGRRAPDQQPQAGRHSGLQQGPGRGARRLAAEASRRLRRFRPAQSPALV
jgi:putative intracellular protease/amidase